MIAPEKEEKQRPWLGLRPGARIRKTTPENLDLEAKVRQGRGEIN